MSITFGLLVLDFVDPGKAASQGVPSLLSALCMSFFFFCYFPLS